MKTPAWQEHFKNAIHDAENLYSKDSTNVSLLLFCLRAKMISSQEYLEWAKAEYMRPVVTDNFFLSYPPQVLLLQKCMSEYTWGPECVPLCEWDGLLIVGCLEIPEKYPHRRPTVFVLCAYENLERQWDLYQKAIKTTSSDPTDMTALAATFVVAKPSSSDIEGLLVDADPEIDETLQEVATDELTPEEAEAGGMPEGFLNEATVVSLAPSSGGGSGGGILDKEKAPSLSDDGHEPTVVAKSISLEPLADISSNKTAIMDVAAIVDNDKTEEIVANDNLRRGPRTVETLVSAPVPKIVGVQEDSAIITTPPPVISSEGGIPKAPLKPTQAPGGGSAAYFLEKVRRQNQIMFDKELDVIFGQMKGVFNHALLLAVGDKDRIVKPIAWDRDVHAETAKNIEFNLKKPSIFRTATGTQKPYHGYVVANDLNDSFFESWNSGQLPEHVTLVPVIDGDNVVGLLMGIGAKTCYTKSTLQMTERMCKDIAQKLLRNSLGRAA